MNTSVNSVLTVAETLSIPERHELIDRLLDGLPESEVKLELSDAWKAEIARRSDELDAGTATTVPWSDIQMRWWQRSRSGG